MVPCAPSHHPSFSDDPNLHLSPWRSPKDSLGVRLGEIAAMHDVQAYQNYNDWKTMQRRGRQRIEKASKDPITRAKLLAEIPSPRPVLLRPQHNECQQAVGRLPPYCTLTTTKSYPSASVTHRFSFLGSFPAEVRNLIYQYAVDYPTCRQLSDGYYKQVEACRAGNRNSSSGGFAISYFTPTILLLCKQITRESLSLLRLCPFVIDRIPPWVMGHPRPLPLTYLISRQTLQNIRFVEIKLSFGDGERYPSGRVWFWVLEEILRVWSGRNSLIRLRIMIKVSNIDIDALWDFELENYTEIMKMIDKFTFRHAAKPNLVQYEHWVVDRDYAFRCGFRNPLIRKHPDPNIWQGSVMEWI